MIRLDNFGKYLTNSLTTRFMAINSTAVSSIEKLTDRVPEFDFEKYKYLDEYGNQVGYLCLRGGQLYVMCPNELGTVVHSRIFTAEGYNSFSSDLIREGVLSDSIVFIDKFYSDSHL